MNKAVVALALVILAGCGQKGPLYIPQPEKPAPEASTKAVSSASAAASESASSRPSGNPSPVTGN